MVHSYQLAGSLLSLRDIFTFNKGTVTEAIKALQLSRFKKTIPRPNYVTWTTEVVLSKL